MKAIVAMAENRVIGFQGKIPWHLPEDLRFFKETTWGKVVVMGRKTYESIGSPLPGRKNIVLSQKQRVVAPGVWWIRDLEEVVRLSKKAEMFVIGGEAVYRALLPCCDEIIVTHVKGVPQGDTFFPSFEVEFSLGTLIRENPKMKIVRYLRRKMFQR